MLKRVLKYTKRVTIASAIGYTSTYFLPPQTQYDLYGNFYAAANFTRAACIFGFSAADYIYGLKGLDDESDEYVEKRAVIHKRTAERVLWLSKKNRGIYLKFGQYMGNLERMIPKYI